MVYTLRNKCVKNLCKRTVLGQLIIENVVTCFLRHSVVFQYRTGWQYSDEDPPMGRRMQGGMTKSRHSTNISLYLGNDAR